ncbi:MAG: hypothetical protein ACPGJU_07405 [Coraliomargarita sp.]
MANRRVGMESAYQLASGGVSIAADELNDAFNLSPNDIAGELLEAGYTLSEDLSTETENCYTRTIPDTILGVAIPVQIWMPVEDLASARIIAQAVDRGVEQVVTADVIIAYGFGAAIISTHQGTSARGVSKQIGQRGNVAINGNALGPNTFVDGGILANGTVGHDNHFQPEEGQIQENLYSTEDQIPNYTDAGSADQLFDFNRFIAVSDEMGTHYASTDAFKAALAADEDGVLEGVIVIDVEDGADDWEASDFPDGIDIRGTLVFNFDDSWGEWDKLMIKCELNVNPADLTNLEVGNPDTYTTGYPPVMSDDSYVASNVDISGVENGKGGYFKNFTERDDLPAIMYRTAICDFHGDLNVSGVVYSPVFAEIENKKDGQLQYISGSVIVGGGIYYENKKRSVSIISYESTTLDRLATAGARGKVFKVVRRD